MPTRKEVFSSIIDQMIERGAIAGEQAGEFDIELEEACGGGDFSVVEAHIKEAIETSGVDELTKNGWRSAIDNSVGP